MMQLTAHAYLIHGGDLGTVTDLLKDEGITVRGNPDCYAVSYESLGVDEVRAITDFASLAPLGPRKYIIIATKSATPEAQTALLKSVEEGTGRSVFFFAVPTGVFVLPTLVSRCVVLKLAPRSLHLEPALEFLALSYKDRLALAEKFGKEHDREGARALVRSLLALASEKKKSDFFFSKEKLGDLLDADRYLASTGSSSKGVIGHLALTL